MSRRAKHRYTEKEANAVWAALTPEEQTEYNGFALGWAWSGAAMSLQAMREIENLGYARVKEGTK